MEHQVRVELIPRMVQVDPDVYAQREQAVERLGNLGHIDPSTGTVSETAQEGWLARINGVEFPVATYGVEPAEEGAQALVSLLVPADAVSIGEPSTGVQQPHVQPPPKNERRSTWGAPDTPDPREGIPGWTPPTSEPVKVDFTPGQLSEAAVNGLVEGIRAGSERIRTGNAGVRAALGAQANRLIERDNAARVLGDQGQASA